ncbi:hypothetical protein A2714_00205 [Candidatus Woesebacteria bacterium RIFCSPHIGHO2_01_FULL_38_9]|uniref:Uncharacterized protein n=2 Tax=Candidatus Woeseibacteriota TaxID=1752722 RepID=A0A1F7Y2M7_9BACT|nr:MAG: hypothetical protein A2714_00205 [Candidatus Woesebacteria bacterium RIFCSPHIGHO2_01_FULL_38_9]OGM58253.1 MAG: hypothetical protein A3A75_04410 [Candidatus Woesebacteria bacterium RIFCSPLOWO2_01_FULL_39_10]
MKDDKEKRQVSLNADTTPILYTDNVNMIANTDGVVLNVMQRVGSRNQLRIVARVGMSREHAKKFVEKLGQLLLKSQGQLVTGKKIVN